MKVLVVEDHAPSQTFLRDLAESQGFVTAVAMDGVEGLERFRAFRPDLVFVDIQMPRMNGLELLDQLRREDPQVIVIVNTAFGSEEHAVAALRHGASNYLTKPIVRADVVPLLQKYAAVVEQRSTDRDVERCVVRRGGTLRFESRPALASGVAAYLVRETGHTFGAADQVALRLGLVELVLNAVEHGNLGITYEDKTRALERPDGLEALYAERRASPVLADRRVSVDFEITSDDGTWIITDEGAGFDWRQTPDPCEGAGLLATHGRGIFLARFQFDVLEYQGSGNVVRAVKRATHASPRSTSPPTLIQTGHGRRTVPAGGVVGRSDAVLPQV